MELYVCASFIYWSKCTIHCNFWVHFEFIGVHLTSYFCLYTPKFHVKSTKNTILVLILQNVMFNSTVACRFFVTNCEIYNFWMKMSTLNYIQCKILVHIAFSDIFQSVPEQNPMCVAHERDACFFQLACSSSLPSVCLWVCVCASV